MAVIEGHADFRIALGSADTGAVTGARINNHDGPFGFGWTLLDFLTAIAMVGWYIVAAAFGNSDQCIIDWPLKIFGVQDHFIIICQHRRLAATDMFDVVVASFAENIRKNDRPLHGIHDVFAQMFLPVGPFRILLGSCLCIHHNAPYSLLIIHNYFRYFNDAFRRCQAVKDDVKKNRFFIHIAN